MGRVASAIALKHDSTPVEGAYQEAKGSVELVERVIVESVKGHTKKAI